MPRIVFTENLQRHVSCPDMRVHASTIREALEQVFAQQQTLRGYILDDQGELRRHMLIAIDGELISDRSGLSDGVQEDSEIYVIQALSGG